MASPRSSVDVLERQRPGTHIGAAHLVHEYIGGRLNKLQVTFVPPGEYFGDLLDTSPGAVAICGRSGLLERPVDFGRLIHLALPRPWGCELHSRFWLGYVRSRSGSSLTEVIGNRPWARRLQISDPLGRALEAHCHEEMSTLAGLLPALYASETGGPRTLGSS